MLAHGLQHIELSDVPGTFAPMTLAEAMHAWGCTCPDGPTFDVIDGFELLIVHDVECFRSITRDLSLIVGRSI